VTTATPFFALSPSSDSSRSAVLDVIGVLLAKSGTADVLARKGGR
jgi:hypothetical protein